MQETAKKVKGFQWYNQDTEQAIWEIELEKGPGWLLKNKTPIFRGFERTFVQRCLVLSGLLDT